MTRGPSGKVNESLSRAMAYKGDDGLTAAERTAYEACRSLASTYEACYRRLMYSSPQKQKAECGPLRKRWQECTEEKMASLTAATPPRT